jgi:protein required for attachment to host cells
MKLTGKIAEKGLKPFIQKHEMRGGMEMPRIWVLVADKSVARIFMKDDGHLELIAEAFPQESLNAGLNNKSIGRVVSAGGHHHKFEPHMEQSRLDEVLFTQDIAHWLDMTKTEDAFDRLVVVAAPRVLGDLRNTLGRAVKSRIVAEVDKDLTKLNEKSLLDALDDIVWL